MRTDLRVWLAGTLLIAAGPLIHVSEFFRGAVAVPWYALVLSAVGLTPILFVTVRRPARLRVVLASVLALVTIFIWLYVLIGLRITEEPGNVQPGTRLPEFSAYLADGSPFGLADLKSRAPCAVVFFRHW